MTMTSSNQHGYFYNLLILPFVGVDYLLILSHRINVPICELFKKKLHTRSMLVTLNVW